jgi:hypothetical protein
MDDRKPSDRRPIRPGRAGVALAAVIIVLLPSQALAYIDPGYGALIVQAALSAALGALFFARHAVRQLLERLGSLIGLRRPRRVPVDAVPSDEPPPSSRGEGQ